MTETSSEVLDERPDPVDVVASQSDAPQISHVDLDKVRQLDLLKQEKQRHEAAVSEINAQIADLEAELVEQMAATGQATVDVDGRRASMGERVYGSRLAEVDESDYYSAFVDAGPEWADLVQERVNANTLSARLREWEESHGPLPDSLPPTLRDVLKVTYTYRITFSNSARSHAARRIRAARGA